MTTDPYSCDRIRKDTLETMKYLEPSVEKIIVQGRYFERVDDKSSTNNFRDLIKDASKNCEKMVNTKFWIPLYAQTGLEKLVDQLEFNWPKKIDPNYRHISNVFDEIDHEFQRKGLKSSTVPGVKKYEPNNQPKHNQNQTDQKKETSESFKAANADHNPILDDERLKNIDKNIAERILNEVVHKQEPTMWDDIAGLENVKQAINEIVVYPMQNPDLFKGLLAPAKGLLLFGPPGTGKTLIGKCIASESGATFFAISASSLTSKWIGEGEKMVRALFAVARCMAPSVVFIDEIDSLLTQRVDGEHDSTRRMKTEFLVQFDGVSTASDDRLLIVGATNRPQELDEAARRRFTKRLYVPLPEDVARKQIIKTLMGKAKSSLTDECIDYISARTEGFSGADMATLCKEAAMGPLRALIRAKGNAKNLDSNDVGPISRVDFEAALRRVKASVSDLEVYEEWDSKYGASRENSEFSQ